MAVKKNGEEDRLSGTPKGKGGIGRKEEASGSGVYPASVGPENIPSDAEVKGQAEWGQGERGAEGYDDSGQSELSITPEEAERYQQAKKEKEKEES